MKWLIPFLLISNAFAADCDLHSLLKENKSFYDQTKPFIELGPGQGSVPNPYFPFDLEQLPEDQRRDKHVRAALLKVAPARSQADMDQMMNEIRDLIIEEISGAGNPGPDQQLMIARLRTIKWKQGDINSAEGTFDKNTNTIIFHPNALKSPKLALVSLISHEFSHSIDYCNAGCPNYHAKPTGELNNVLESLPQDPATEKIRTIVRDASTSGLNILNTGSLEPDQRSRFAEFAQRAGLEINDPGIPITRNPLRETFKCLNEKLPNDFPAPVTQQSDCRYQNYGEKSAQIWAGRITGNYIQRSPVTSKGEAMGLLTNFFNGAKSEMSLDGKGRELNEMFLTHPAVQRMFDCTPRAEPNCMLKFNPSVTIEEPTLRSSLEAFNKLLPEPVQVSCGLNNP